MTVLCFNPCSGGKLVLRNTSKEETNEARTYDKATNGTERAENVDSTEQQQLPYDPLFQLYQINDDGGYSFCRIENIGHTEQLPDDTLYHFFEGNGETIYSKNETDRAGTLPSTKNTMLCTHDLPEDSSGNQDYSNENENAYAQVNKTKET